MNVALALPQLPVGFTAFPSLENTYRQNLIGRVEQLGYHDEMWVVTEKIHGANFSFHLCESSVALEGVGLVPVVDIKCARRTDMLAEGEKFYNYRPVLDKYRAGLESLFTALQAQANITTLAVYGELFGGNVASGMCYPLEQDFAAFDILADGQPLNKLVAFEYLKLHGINVVPVIGVYPNIHAALAVNPAFTSTLKRADFDGAEDHCEAEGVVIEPVTPRWYDAEKRIYFKQKTPRFLESGGNKVQKPKETLPPELEEVLLQSFGYITKPRFESVASKVGEVTIKDIGKLTGLMTQDILVDMQKDEVEIPDSKVFMKLLQGQVTSFLRPILLGIEGV